MRSSPAILSVFLLLACTDSHSPGESDAGARWDECALPSECVVVPASCCGACGVATRGDAIAVHRARVSEHRASVCGDDFGCPACAGVPDPTLVATCDAGRCVVVDLQVHAATECETAGECRVRASECCECGATIGPSSVVAVSDGSAYEALVCDPGMGCPECAPDYPDTLSAICEDARCRVVVSGTP